METKDWWCSGCKQIHWPERPINTENGLHYCDFAYYQFLLTLLPAKGGT